MRMIAYHSRQEIIPRSIFQLHRFFIFIACKWKFSVASLFFSLAIFTSHGQNIKILSSATLEYNYELTPTAFCSDGSDRAYSDGVPRFDGAMEGIGITYKNYQYVSYYESNGDIVVARRNIHKNNLWEKSIIQNHRLTRDDRHRKIAMQISKGDGVIHLAFDHHNETVFNYAKSAVGVADNPASVTWDNTVFTYTPNLGINSENGLVTYPSFIQINETGDLMIYWRTGGAVGGEMNLAHYNSTNHLWSHIGQFSSRYGYYNGLYGERGPYHAGFNSDAQGNIHVAWLWREEEDLRGGTFQYGNHGLYYANSKDGGFSWNDTNDSIIADTRLNQTISIDNIGGTVADIPMYLEPSNAQIYSAFDTQTGELHVFSTHYVDGTKTKKVHHYTRLTNGEWTTQISDIPDGGGSLIFTDDYLFCVTREKVHYSTRLNDFETWNEIKLNYDLPTGESNWDLSRIEEGLISLVLQLNPTSLGTPSPLRIYEFRIAENLNKPSIAFSKPLQDTTVTEGYTLELKVDAINPETKIENIKLYIDDFMVRQIDTPPYLWGGSTTTHANELNNLTSGTYLIKAVSTDSSGNTDEAYLVLTVVEQKIQPCSASASTSENGHPPLLAMDGNYNTSSYWSSRGRGATLVFDLCHEYAINKMAINWLYGDRWIYEFEIAVSIDSINWTTIYTGQSSGKSADPELLSLPTSIGRYVRYTGNGNTLSSLNSIVEWDLYGTETGTMGQSLSKEKMVMVYPNPTSSEFTIELPNAYPADISIYNMLGKLIYTKKNITETLVLKKNNIFKRGSYIIVIQQNNIIQGKERIVIL